MGPSTTGVLPTLASAASADRVSPPALASPTPIRTQDMWASGARSPDAPTEPLDGMQGRTSPFTKAIRVSSVSRRTPDAPFDREAIFSTISRRVTFSSSGAPTPQAWLRTRFF